MTEPRIVGIDFGTKRVGLAVSDPFKMFAQPDGSYTEEQAIARLDALLSGHGIDAIVVGWPLTPEGEEGAATDFVRPFVDRLRNRYTSVRIITWDERFSSQRARRALIDAGVKRKHRRRKGRVDAAAAAVILQEFLDENGDNERTQR